MIASLHAANDVPFPHATKEIRAVCAQAIDWLFSTGSNNIIQTKTTGYTFYSPRIEAGLEYPLLSDLACEDARRCPERF